VFRILRIEVLKGQPDLMGAGGFQVATAQIETTELFGLCVECEEPIAAKRLELMPYVELCVECQAARDGKRGLARRSLTDFK